MAPESL